MKSLSLVFVCIVIQWLRSAWAEETQIISPIVSYQFQENPALGTGEPLISPIASYQYVEWAGHDVVRTQKSPDVSYFWDFDFGFDTLTLSGRVFSSTLQPVEKASITASVLDKEILRTTTTSDGSYLIPDLPPQLYTIKASKPGTLSEVRVIRLTSNTHNQNFLLNEFPSPTATTVAGSTPPIGYRPAPTPEGSFGVLKWFNNGSFETAPISLPAKTTVILTHGWKADADKWLDAARAMSAIIPQMDLNILVWDWREVADPVEIPIVDLILLPEYATIEAGVQLGQAVYSRLGEGYAEKLHFIGHSLGTLVNRYAADYLHGRQFKDRVVSKGWNPKQTQLTLLDEAELGRLITAISGPVLIVPSVAAYGTDALDWKSPVPVEHGWIDNYFSAYGLPYRRAFNVQLNYGIIKYKPPLNNINPIYNPEAHSYASEWYVNTIKRPGMSLAGFRHSPEFHEVDPIRSGEYPPSGQLGPDRYYRQIQPCFAPPCFLTADEELQLEAPHGFGFDDCIIPLAFGGDYRVIAQGMVATVQNSADFVADVTVEAARITGNAVVTTYETTKKATIDVYNYSTSQIQRATDTIVDVGSTAALRIQTTLRNFAPTSQVRRLNVAETELWEHATLPLAVPEDTVALVFDFSVSGDFTAATIVFGANGTNIFTLPAQYVTGDVLQSSRVFDARPFAGRTNDFFFGFTGNTSTNCTLIVENIRYFSLSAPKLTVDVRAEGITLSWPSTADFYTLEVSNTMAANSWSPVKETPILFAGHYRQMLASSGSSTFYRLRR